MPEVCIRICERDYRLVCGEGQENKLAKLAREIDQKASGLLHSFPLLPEAKLFLMVSLMLADQLAEAQTNIEDSKRTDVPQFSSGILPSENDVRITEFLNDTSERLNTLSEKIRKLGIYDC
jgi:cell division protein ZapA